MPQKVVIIGHSWLSRLSLVRSVAGVGCEVTVVALTSPFTGNSLPKKPVDCYSKYVKQFYFCPRKDRKSLISILLEKCSDPARKVVLIPDGDDVVVTLDENKAILKENFVFPHIINEPSSMAYWMDKTHQKAAAKEAGLAVAEAIVVDIKDGHYEIPQEVRYPCFPKPLATMNGGKGGMRRCDNADDLSGAFEFLVEYRSPDVKVMVEEFKEIDKEYALLGFSDGKEVVIPGLFEFLVPSKRNTGIALQGMVRPVSGFEEIVKRFKLLVLRIGFVGVFDIDFYESGGTVYFCELNLRFGGSGYALTKMGINLPGMMVRYLCGEDVNGTDSTVLESRTYTNERMCLDDWNSGYISSKEFFKFLRTPDIRFIPDQADKSPLRRFNLECAYRFFINSTKAVLGRK